MRLLHCYTRPRALLACERQLLPLAALAGTPATALHRCAAPMDAASLALEGVRSDGLHAPQPLRAGAAAGVPYGSDAQLLLCRSTVRVRAWGGDSQHKTLPVDASALKPAKHGAGWWC